jgi:hypothetical protein
MITKDQWSQWLVVTASLLIWNFLVVCAGEQQHQANGRQASRLTAIALFLGAVALLALAMILVAASRDSVLFPGREAIHFMVISVPLMIWANVHLRNG